MNNKNKRHFSELQRKKAYCGRKLLGTQTGMSKVLLLIILSGIGYGAYFANQKGILTADTVSLFSKTVSNKVS